MQVRSNLAELEHKRSRKLLAFVSRNRLIGKRRFGRGLWVGQRRKPENRAAQGARDGVSVLVFSIGQDNDRELVFRKVIEAAAVSHQRSMLTDSAVIFFMVQDHGKSVLRFGVLRGHMRGRAF